MSALVSATRLDSPLVPNLPGPKSAPCHFADARINSAHPMSGDVSRGQAVPLAALVAARSARAGQPPPYSPCAGAVVSNWCFRPLGRNPMRPLCEIGPIGLSPQPSPQYPTHAQFTPNSTSAAPVGGGRSRSAHFATERIHQGGHNGPHQLVHFGVLQRAIWMLKRQSQPHAFSTGINTFPAKNVK